MSERLPTDHDVAELLGISVDHLRRLCRAGSVPHVKIGRAYRFEQSDVAAIISARRVEPSEATANPWGVRRRGRAS